MNPYLAIIFQGREIAQLHYDLQSDKLSWNYHSEYLQAEDFLPASLSIQSNNANDANDATIRHFLEGLLPDNPEVLNAWGKRFHVSPQNSFRLLENVGEDCAGALQFVQPDRAPLILRGELNQLIALTEEQLAKRIKDLRLQEKAIPLFDTEGRFSLAGAQSKDALYLKDENWYLPMGNIPTTHILKPELRDYESHSLNEHTCLVLAQESGLPCAESFLTVIADEPTICVKRYDRYFDENKEAQRIHQEDFCQALGLDPKAKYQNQGGPTIPQIIELLATYSSDSESDIDNFLRALALNWAIAGTDAHAKNYSLLHAPGGFTRLAPLYDLASYLPYRDPKSRKTQMAMKYGHTYHLHKIDRHQWTTLATESRLKPKRVLPIVEEFLTRLREEALPKTHAHIAEKHDSPFLTQLTEQIGEHTSSCLQSLQS